MLWYSLKVVVLLVSTYNKFSLRNKKYITYQCSVKLERLENLWDYENMFQTRGRFIMVPGQEAYGDNAEIYLDLL